MKQEDKELLFKDLCARLPYEVIIEIDKSFITKKGTFRLSYEHLDINNMLFIKPYLRPMSSMTKKEKIKYQSCCKSRRITGATFELLDTIESIDWLNTHHFDYRGLIEKGLALEAPEGMYNIKEK